MSIFFSNRARGLLLLKQYEQAAGDAQIALSLDQYNIKAYLLRSQSWAYLAAKGSTHLIDDALHDCSAALQKCKDKDWPDAVEKTKLLRTKLRILKSNAERTQEAAEWTEVVKYYTVTERQEVLKVPETELQGLVRGKDEKGVPDYFTCLISLVRVRKDVMAKPVTTDVGLTYDEKSLTEYISRYGRVEPSTRYAYAGSQW